MEGVDSAILEAYLKEFSSYNPKEYKIVMIYNAGFHATKNIKIPENICLINIPPYTPELNPSEKIWQFLKERFKNPNFENIGTLKKWLHKTVKELIVPERVFSITKTEFYNNLFKAYFY